MTAGHLSIRVGDQTYGVETVSAEAQAYFRRAYAGCLGQCSDETNCFELKRTGRTWRILCDGADFAHGSIRPAMRQLDWELTRRAVKQDSVCATFHAAWVVRDSRAAMFAGEGGSGKSRLCLQLLERGCRCGAEDVSFLQGDRLMPFPRAIQLRGDDPALREVDTSRIFRGYDGRVCVEVGAEQAAGGTNTRNLFVAFLDPSAPSGPARPLAPLEALRRLFALCHRLDRVTLPLLETLTDLAVAGRMFVLPRENATETVLHMLEI